MPVSAYRCSNGCISRSIAVSVNKTHLPTKDFALEGWGVVFPNRD